MIRRHKPSTTTNHNGVHREYDIPPQISQDDDGCKESCDASAMRRETYVVPSIRRSLLLLQYIPSRINTHDIQSNWGGGKSSMKCTALLCIGGILILVISLQLDAYIREYQGPLDHVTTSILAYDYGFSCPDFSFDNGSSGNKIDSTTNNSNEIISWDCNHLLHTHHDDGSTTNNENYHIPNNFPRIFMIGARESDEDTFDTWKQIILQLKNRTESHSNDRGINQSTEQNLPHLERINTLRISNQYALSGGAPRHSTTPFIDMNHNQNDSTTTIIGESNNNQKQYLCRKLKWEHRLFAVYQSVFANLLTTYPNDTGFVILEDDAILINSNAFLHEVCSAHQSQFGFYSLYRSPSQSQLRGKTTTRSSSCNYIHGTVAFYIRRSIMEQIVNERRRSQFCRFPIDMYISKLGPWYATWREIVGHADVGGRVGSIG